MRRSCLMMQRMSRSVGTRTIGLLLFAALWVAALPLAVATLPGLAALLPDHTHTTLRGTVAPHTHATDAAEGARCATTAASAEAIACGADDTAAFAVLIPGIGPAAVIATGVMLTSRLAAPRVHRAPAPEVTTPPPRG